ncbi:MAG: nucleotidyl transferase AbiEii/AbiGii toxin family protein [Treponema sp.]|jgi:predicted nucleotidyltransferase component of viral defense system|nr:nucleotidyl transferase AbiEii/AbiGii toxin family protein [Treponema sp.]
MNTINKCGVLFFLTGGTALSRAYYNHRYSDDLDFFVNDDDDYSAQVKEVFFKLKEDGFFWDPIVEFISNKNFTSFKVGWDKSDILLKLDFVNDVAAHFGEIVKTDLFDRTDSIRNMLSNKLTALFRFAAKDVADIREIALHEKVDWQLAINDARQKEAGLEIPIICDILQGMPQSEYETIAWTKKPSWEEFRNDIDRIVHEMISGENNTI